MAILSPRLGELFFASGEVAVKANQSTSPFPNAQRLAVIGNEDSQENVDHVVGESHRPYQRLDANASAQVGKDAEDIHTIERLLEAATKSLRSIEEDLEKLARDGVQAKFDLEDDQARYEAAQAQVSG